jgi:hypothetical protein
LLGSAHQGPICRDPLAVVMAQFRHARSSWLQSRAHGNEQVMTDEQDRERESQQTDENKFVELADETAEETRQAAERLASDPIVNEPPEDE